ncbi:helix-turn-helix transcriptional regulator [Paenibacillus illinoisensis]|uniref:Transcriptional regulator n=1 Tax=Paenibacillus illinoisensis TaxID=59845 RepID=A0A2W0C743_9BACL|nr:YafY family protein [Paenibacillus illinoisensis]PYY26179.1 Uncharacterized protein PIL02S_05569 [Paenibacillus illinoisensis]
MKLERLISMIYKLLNNEVVSASMLAEEFQVSPRTIYRDIDVICAAGFPVVSYQGMNGGYGMMDGYKMDKSLLGSYDVHSLITVLRSLSTVFEDERAQGTIERLQTVGSEQQSPTLAVDLETHRTDHHALRELRSGITKHTVVRFDYINSRNERTTRELEPVMLYFKYRNWYVYGFCRIRQDYREFRLSRMMNLSLTQESFLPHSEVPKERSLRNEEWKNQISDVEFRVAPEALAEALDHFHQAEKQFNEDGSMTMQISVYQPLQARWLQSFLLGLGSRVEVIKPRELRGILKEQLQQAILLYEEV